MRPSLDTAERLSPLERLQVICEVIGTYPRVRWTLRHVDLEEAVQRARGQAKVRDTYVIQEGDIAFRLAWIVELILDRLPGDTRCLTRTLVLVRMLSRRGIGCMVVLGVRVAPEFGSHAWPELAGRPLMRPIEATGQRLLEL